MGFNSNNKRRTLTEEWMEAVKEMLLTALEHIEDQIYIFNESGSILYWNQAAYNENGYEQNESVSILSVFPNYLKLQNQKWIKTHSTNKDKSEELVYRKNLTCYPVQASFYSSGNCGYPYYMICASNITQYKQCKQEINQMQQQLVETEQRKNEFLANITHELKTPINGILGLSELLLEGNLSREQKENIIIMKQCCMNMTEIISHILDYTRIMANKLILELREFDLYALIENAIRIQMPTINTKGLKVQINIEPHVPKIVYGDELRLGQILNNLISNAVKFTWEGRIVLEVAKTYEDEKEVELFFLVMDTGIGIATEDMDKLFHSFSQVDGSITRKYGGSGLGLAISRSLVQKMGGDIQVDSEKGKGSTFSFTVRFKRKQIISQLLQEEIPLNHIEHKYTPILQETAELNESVVSFRDLSRRVERIMICIELELWGKAERCVMLLRQEIPKSAELLRKETFLLLLAIRREDYQNSLKSLERLKEMIQ